MHQRSSKNSGYKQNFDLDKRRSKRPKACLRFLQETRDPNSMSQGAMVCQIDWENTSRVSFFCDSQGSLRMYARVRKHQAERINCYKTIIFMRSMQMKGSMNSYLCIDI
jgi:hypothetical protein